MSAVISVQEKPLIFGKKYHCSVYFNYYEGPKSGKNEDHKMSEKFLKGLEEELSSIGCGKILHFYNLPPGSNIFNATFSSMLIQAEKIVVIFTSGFIENHWHKFSHQNCFKSLIDEKKSDQFLGIVVGLSKDEISDELGLNNMILVHFEEEFMTDADKWSKVREFFLEDQDTTRTRSNDQLTVEATTSDIDTDGLDDSNRGSGDGLDDSNRGNGEGDVGSRNSNIVHREDTIMNVEATTSDIDTDGLDDSKRGSGDGMDDSNRGNGEGDVGSRNSNVVHREDTIMKVQETGDNLEVDGVNEVGEAADLNDSHSTVVHGIDDSPGAAAEVVNNSPGAVAVVSDNGVIFRAWTFWDWLKKNVNL